MKKPFLFIFIVIIGGLIITNSMACAGKSKKITIKYASYGPSVIGPAKVVIKWYKELERRSQGKIEVKFFHSGTLAGAKDIPTYVAKNIAQTGDVGFGYQPGVVPLFRVADLPFLSMKGDALSRAVMEMSKEYQPLRKQLEEAGLKLLILAVPERAPLACRKPAYKVEDMSGWKIRAYGPFAAIIQSWGATPVAMPFSDIPEGLERGLIDAATCVYFSSFYGLKMPEIVKYCVDTGERFSPSVGNCMSLKFYNSLPSDLKKLIDDMADESWKFYAEHYNEEIDSSAQLLAKTDMQFIRWSDEEVRKARQLCVPAGEKLYFDEMKKRGMEKEARELYKLLSERTKKYETESIMPHAFDVLAKYRNP